MTYAVVLIEDNPAQTRLVREHLRDPLGGCFELRAAGTLAAGLALLTERVADAVLLDLALPDSAGLATLQRVREHAPDTPVVVLSGSDDDALALEAVRAGAADYLPKQHADGVVLTRTLRHAVERRRAEDARQASELRYRTIVETAEEGIVQLDAEGRVRMANRRLAHMIGVEPEQLLRRRFAELLAPASREPAELLLARACAEGRRRAAELKLSLADGSTRWVLAAVGVLPVPGAGAPEAVVMLSDIDARVLGEQQLVDMAQRLERRAAAADSAEQVLQRAEAHVAALLALGTLADAPLERRALDVSALAAEVAAAARGSVPRRGVDVSIDPGLVDHADAALLRSLLAALLDSALRHARAHVHFGAAERDPDGGIAYVVEDDGTGVDDALERGLSTARRVVERHGGRLHVLSRPGAGTRMHFTLGRAAAAPSAGATT